jgi:ribosome biogenesis protein
LEFETPVPFDFMISNTLIRTNLKKFLTQNRISGEEIIEIEYMPVTSFTEESQSSECPAWVGALKSFSNNTLVAGCYNGQLRCVNSATLAEMNTVQAHELPIRALTAWKNGNNQFLATASKDNTAKCWLMSPEGRFNCVASLESAVSSVETVTVMGNSFVITGDWGGNLFGYDLSKIDVSHLETAAATAVAVAAAQSEKSQKKRKKNAEAPPAVEVEQVLVASPVTHLLTIHAHSQALSGLEYCPLSDRLFTASWDHSVKLWDMERQECVHTIVGAKVATSLNLNSKLHLIATSHSDGRVRLWDSRSREGTVSLATISRSPPHWVSQVPLAPPLSRSLF